MHTEAFSALLQDRRINTSPLAVKLLGYLPLCLAWDRWDRIDQRALADALGTYQPHISAALRRLVEAGAVETNGRRGLGARYRLSKAWGWRGTPGQFHAAQATDPSPPLPPPAKADNPALLPDYTLCGTSVHGAFTPPSSAPSSAASPLAATIRSRTEADKAAAALARVAAARAALLDGLRRAKAGRDAISQAEKELAAAVAAAEEARAIAARWKKREAAQKGRAAAAATE